MKYTKSAIGMLTGQYRSVLKKCILINLGLFALALPTKAETTFPVPADDSIWMLDTTENSLPVNQYTIDDNGQITDTVRKYVQVESGDAEATPPAGYENKADGYLWVKSGSYNLLQLTKLSSSSPADVVVNYQESDIDSTKKTYTKNAGYISHGSYPDPDIVGGNNTSVEAGAVYTDSLIYGSFYAVHAYSGGSALAYINQTSPLGDINNDFIYNRASYTGYRDEVHALGGAVAFNKATVGNIGGNFIGNGVTINDNSDYFIYAQGGAIYNGFKNSNYDTGVVTNAGVISGDFVGNYTHTNNNNNGVGYSYGGAIYNGGTIEGIESDFISNYTFGYAKKRTPFAYGGAIYSAPSATSAVISAATMLMPNLKAPMNIPVPKVACWEMSGKSATFPVISVITMFMLKIHKTEVLPMVVLSIFSGTALLSATFPVILSITMFLPKE